uniref:Uncharacterized protein n=1 Tax=Brassica oleracea var. oleracea TaxID=109376 RepID=A0A0D2ZS10_BRAOL
GTNFELDSLVKFNIRSAASPYYITLKDLSNFELEIVQVAIESLDDKEPPSLKSKAAVIYIAYKDLAKARTGEPYHCQAVVRRVINEATGTLSIQGDC